TPHVPTRGALVHTNHFLSPPPGTEEVSIYAMPDSLVRLQRVQSALLDSTELYDIKALHRVLSDHADFPAAVCCHPDPREDSAEQWATVMSVVMDLQDRTMWLASGNPCASEFVELDFGDLLHKPSHVATLRDQVTARPSSE